MTNKRYQIFISSTFDDMQSERRAIWQRLIDHNYIVAGMETFPASSASPFEYIKPIIAESDYFVLVIADRYGSAPDQSTISYTEMEFDFAVENSIPILVFLVNEAETKRRSRTDKDLEKSEKLKSFVKKASNGRTITYWTDESDLAFSVVQSVIFEERRNPRSGWTRDSDININDILIQNISLTEKVSELESRLNTDETMTYQEMANCLTTKLDFAIFELDKNGRYGNDHDFTVEVGRIFSLERIFDDPSYDSIRTSINLVGRNACKIPEETKTEAPRLDVDKYILTLRRLDIVSFGVEDGPDNIRRGRNWLLAHEAARKGRIGDPPKSSAGSGD